MDLVDTIERALMILKQSRYSSSMSECHSIGFHHYMTDCFPRAMAPASEIILNSPAGIGSKQRNLRIGIDFQGDIHRLSFLDSSMTLMAGLSVSCA
jgi:hypothetical protein